MARGKSIRDKSSIFEIRCVSYARCKIVPSSFPLLVSVETELGLDGGISGVKMCKKILMRSMIGPKHLKEE